jgi:hypothetical protein
MKVIGFVLLAVISTQAQQTHLYEEGFEVFNTQVSENELNNNVSDTTWIHNQTLKPLVFDSIEFYTVPPTGAQLKVQQFGAVQEQIFFQGQKTTPGRPYYYANKKDDILIATDFFISGYDIRPCFNCPTAKQSAMEATIYTGVLRVRINGKWISVYISADYLTTSIHRSYSDYPSIKSKLVAFDILGKIFH